MQRFAALVGLSMLVAGCTGAAVTAETAKAAPDRLQAAMGPEGDLKETSGTMEMSMRMDMGDSSMSMAMAMQMAQEFFAGGATSVTMRITEFEVTGAGSGEAPDMSDVKVTVFCAPDRWVMITEGMSGRGAEDISLETANTKGTCISDSPEDAADMERLTSAMGPELDMFGSSLMAGFQAPEYTFVSLDGNTATYRVDAGMGGMDMTMNLTATFDGEGRIGRTSMSYAMSEMGMRLEGTTEYSYGSRDEAPDTRGERRV